MDTIGWIFGNVAEEKKAEAIEAAMHAAEADAEGRGAKFGTAADALRFLLAGNARVTLVSGKTGTRFTYRVRAKKVEGGTPDVYFVSVLTGSNNEADFTFLGTVFEAKRYAHGRRSRIGAEAPSAKAFAWAIGYLLRGELPPGCEVHHEGRCGKCARALTVPESILTGLGPICGGR